MNFFKALKLILHSFSDACAIVYIESKKDQKTPEETVVRNAKKIKKLALFGVCIIVPITFILTKLRIVKGLSIAQKAILEAFIKFSLIESASYMEWRDCDQIIAKIDQEKIKEALNDEKMNDEKRAQFLKFMINLIGGMGIFSMRFENKEEYLARQCPEESKEVDNPVVEHFADEYDEIVKLDSYSKIYKGLRIVFLRKPQGTSNPKASFGNLIKLIPGMG